MITKYLRYRHDVTEVNPSFTVHLNHFNDQQMTLSKFYANNAPIIVNQIAKFHVNLPKQTAAFVRSPQKHFSFVSLWITLDTDLKLKLF